MERKDRSSTQKGPGDDTLAAIWNTPLQSQSPGRLAILTESMELLSETREGMRK
jgi:hypothetical protein